MIHRLYCHVVWTTRSLVEPTNPGEFWTMILAMGTVGLTVVAYRGLRSLRLAKTDIQTRAQREARTCAILRCEEMAQRILPQNGKLLDRFAASKIPVFAIKSANDVQFDPDNTDHLAAASAWVQTLPQDIHVECLTLLNRLEAWAMYFTKQVADHEIAFGPCGRVFCLFVVQYYAILLERRAGKTSGRFRNIVELFKSWRGALQQQMTMDDLAQKVSLLQEQRRTANPLQPPLGTQLDD